MRTLLVSVLSLLIAAPLAAQHRVDLGFDIEGVRRTGRNTDFTPNETRFDPTFATGGGIGGGVNFFLSDRMSVELKVAALESHLRVRTIGSDFFAIADLGHAQIYPITALLQWHTEHGTLRPYVGAGVGHIIMHNISKRVGGTGGANGIEFKDPTGLVLNAGLEMRISRRWGLNGDVRYVPIETHAQATFTGTQSSVAMDVKPLIVATGIVYHF